MRWVLVALVLGLIAAGVALFAVIVARRRHPETTPMTGDQLIALGVIFTGAGVALTISAGPYMLGMLALGIIYLAMGARMKHREGTGEDEPDPQNTSDIEGTT